SHSGNIALYENGPCRSAKYKYFPSPDATTPIAFGRSCLRVAGEGFDFVIWIPDPPSTWYIQISRALIPKFVFDTKMYFPVGSHEGDAISLLGSFDTCFTPVPSVCITKTLSLPSRSERNAIHCPSGENFGCPSNDMPPSINFASPPSIGIV